MNIFKSADILLPDVESMEKWAVIACDQFTSQPEYWDEAESIVGNAPSALNLILPEARLSVSDDSTIEKINLNMQNYLSGNVFTTYPDSYIYVERTLKNGQIRRGIIGAIDLEAYDPAPDSVTAVRATEKTVMERIPPRVKVRKDASLELPHTLLLCDDEEDMLLGFAETRKESLPCLYDFDLMLGGGHICAYLISGSAAKEFDVCVETYSAKTTEKYTAAGLTPILFAVGDGNHSLATAKACYDNLKAQNPGADLSAHCARYALVELENIQDASQQFEPIHRIIKNVDAKALVDTMTQTIGAEKGTEIRWFSGSESGSIYLDTDGGQLPVAIIQKFLDTYLESNSGEIDYIHGDDTVINMASDPSSVGIILPAIAKNSFFKGISVDGVLPRKTFSMGHAEEKRYYIEARVIVE